MNLFWQSSWKRKRFPLLSDHNFRHCNACVKAVALSLSLFFSFMAKNDHVLTRWRNCISGATSSARCCGIKAFESEGKGTDEIFRVFRDEWNRGRRSRSEQNSDEKWTITVLLLVFEKERWWKRDGERICMWTMLESLARARDEFLVNNKKEFERVSSFYECILSTRTTTRLNTRILEYFRGGGTRYLRNRCIEMNRWEGVDVYKFCVQLSFWSLARILLLETETTIAANAFRINQSLKNRE